MLAKRICLTINWFFCWLSFPLFLWPWHLIHGWNWKEKLDAGHSGIKGLSIEVFKINSSLSWVNGSAKGLQGLGYAESPRSLILPSTKTLGRAFLTTIFFLGVCGNFNKLIYKGSNAQSGGLSSPGRGGGGKISWKGGVEALNCLKHKCRHTLATTWKKSHCLCKWSLTYIFNSYADSHCTSLQSVI